MTLQLPEFKSVGIFTEYYSACCKHFMLRIWNQVEDLHSMPAWCCTNVQKVKLIKQVECNHHCSDIFWWLFKPFSVEGSSLIYKKVHWGRNWVVILERSSSAIFLIFYPELFLFFCWIKLDRKLHWWRNRVVILQRSSSAIFCSTG